MDYPWVVWLFTSNRLDWGLPLGPPSADLSKYRARPGKPPHVGGARGKVPSAMLQNVHVKLPKSIFTNTYS